MIFTVLFVCTGNICRSPMAERLFAHRIVPGAPVRAASAGTTALVGHPMDAPAALVLRELGGDPGGHVGRSLTSATAGSADLVLTATTAHRDAVLRLNPSAGPRTFALREFARIGAAVPASTRTPTADVLRARVADIDVARRLAPNALPMLNDIGDPFGAGLGVVRDCGVHISASVDAALCALGLL